MVPDCGDKQRHYSPQDQAEQQDGRDIAQGPGLNGDVGLVGLSYPLEVKLLLHRVLARLLEGAQGNLEALGCEIALQHDAVVRRGLGRQGLLTAGDLRHFGRDVRLENTGTVVQHGQLWIVAGKDRKSTRLNSSHLVISYAV